MNFVTWLREQQNQPTDIGNLARWWAEHGVANVRSQSGVRKAIRTAEGSQEMRDELKRWLGLADGAYTEYRMPGFQRAITYPGASAPPLAVVPDEPQQRPRELTDDELAAWQAQVDADRGTGQMPGSPPAITEADLVAGGWQQAPGQMPGMQAGAELDTSPALDALAAEAAPAELDDAEIARLGQMAFGVFTDDDRELLLMTQRRAVWIELALRMILGDQKAAEVDAVMDAVLGPPQTDLVAEFANAEMGE